MKLASILLLASALVAFAETREQLTKRFSVQPRGSIVVEVDFGSIDVNTSPANEVVVEVTREVHQKDKAGEEEFLQERPVEFSQDGNTVTIRSRAKNTATRRWRASERVQAKYTITVPTQFNARLATSGGGISITGLDGESKASTSGGGLKFARLRGPLDGKTSGGSIHLNDCEGPLKVNTSGGGIGVSGGSGSLEGKTSGGSVSVKNFRGPARVQSSGGSLTIENVEGGIEGITSAGSISATLVSPLPDEVKLSTSGGGITVRVPQDAAFDLDASTPAGGVSCDLPVDSTGRNSRGHLQGTVNGGGKSVVLRTSAGGVRVKKL